MGLFENRSELKIGIYKLHLSHSLMKITLTHAQGDPTERLKTSLLLSHCHSLPAKPNFTVN